MKRRGFTLVEMLVVLVIFGGIMGALLISFLVGKSSFLSADMYIHVQQEARRAFDIMVKELRESGNIDSPTTSPTVGFLNATRVNFQIARGYNINGGCTIPVSCATCTCRNTNTVCWGNDTTNCNWVHYLVNNGQLLRCQSANPDTADATLVASTCRVMANDLQTFLADFDTTAQTVTMRLEIRETSAQLPGGSMGTTPAPLVTRVRLRNT